MLLSKVTYNKYICQKKEEEQFIAVGTVRMFIEPSANNCQAPTITRLTHSLYKAS